MSVYPNTVNFYRFSDRLQDSEAEEQFRLSALGRDIRQTSYFMLIVLVPLILTVAFDAIQLSQTGLDPIASYTSIGLLVVFTFSLLLCTFFLQNSSSPKIFDTILFSMMMFAVFVVAHSHYSRPPDFVGTLYLVVFLVNYILMPVPIRYKCIPSTIYMALLFWMLLTYKEPTYSGESFYSVITIVFINVVGYLASCFIGRARRRAFIHIQEEKELRENLELTLATVKILSGYLPVCSSCMEIRDDDGEWSRPDVYITKHSEAEVSHSICPDCAKKLYDYPPA